MTSSDWWRDAVIYQIYPRSWADSDGDGWGDLAGITSRLEYLVDLGVDAVWVSPFYPSGHRDGGYDVSNYCDVDPRLGTLTDFDALISRAHHLGLKVLIDIIANHTSAEHPWFIEALNSEVGSAERSRYIFSAGLADGSEPPNNWTSLFGGPAWTRVGDSDQWYLHLFDSSQPDLNWDNPQVAGAMRGVLTFWLDRGVDGFRVDVADGMVKAPGLPDMDPTIDRYLDTTAGLPMWDQPGVHDILRDWRKLLDDYGRTHNSQPIAVAEAWVEPPEALARYIRPDELHQSFNFNFLQTPWNAAALRETINSGLTHAERVGAAQTWVLSNHDVMRHASRLGRPEATSQQANAALMAADPHPNVETGLRRARAATLLMLALPGASYLYQGEELGLPEVIDLPDHVRQDPRWHRSQHAELGRDGCRVPMPWDSKLPAFGFSPSGRAWLPQPDSYGALAVSAQQHDETSTLNFYRNALRLRRDLGLGKRQLHFEKWAQSEAADNVLLARSTAPDDDRNTDRGDHREVIVVSNVDGPEIEVPPAWERLIVSTPVSGRSLSADTTAWFISA